MVKQLTYPFQMKNLLHLKGINKGVQIINLDINRKQDENIKQYKLRLCRDKDILNLSWKDVAALINNETGDNWSDSKYRKWFYAYDEGFQDGVDEQVKDDTLLQEIEEKRLELEKEKIKFQDQRREWKKPVREQARYEQVRDDILAEIRRLNETKPLHWYRQLEFNNNSKIHGLALFSDWHKGLFAKNFWNNFDNEEFHNRINKLTNYIIKYGKEQNISVLHTAFLGDLIQGIIHNIVRITNNEDVIQQTMSVSETISEMLSVFANEFEEVRFYNTKGNHSRVTPDKKDSLSKENFNYFIPWWLKERLGDFDNIKFIENKIDDDIVEIEILDKLIFGVHGDKDKVNNVVQNLSLMTRKFPDYIVLGHTHHNEENETHEIDVIVNSSLSGVDEYAKDIRRTSKPAQKFIAFEEGIGRKCTYNILLK